MHKQWETFREGLRLYGRVLREIQQMEPWAIVIAVLSALSEAVLPFIGIYCSARIVDVLTGTKDKQELILYTCLLLGLEFVVTVFMRFVTGRYDTVAQSLNNQGEAKISALLLKVDYERLEDEGFQTLVERYQERCSMLATPGAGLLFKIRVLLRGLTAIGLSAVLVFPLIRLGFTRTGDSFIETPWLLITVLAVMGIGIVLVVIVSAKLNAQWYELNERFGILNRIYRFYHRTLVTEYQSGKEIRLYHEQALINREANGELLEHGAKITNEMGRKTGQNTALVALVGAILGCGVYLFIGLKATLGLFTLGYLMQYMMSFLQVVNGVSQVAGLGGDIPILARYFKTYFELLDTPPVKYRGTLPVEKRSDCEYELEFRNVSFRYPGAEEYALKDFSIRLHVGERLAVVGMNGSGKTTMIKLLCRLYDPQEGEILLNGINIQKYDYDEYQTLFSVVFQDFSLFSFPLGQNVASAVDYNAGQVWDCLKKAGAETRAKEFPDGLDTLLYKDFDEAGVEISGGEAQKLALARALYKEAPFIILDEPTAALDPIAEFDIYKRFNEFVGEKTAVYISHRLSSCRFCDDIAVFHEGRMVQRGSHEELLKQEDGKYFELWNAQSQYYEVKKRSVC